MGKAFLFLTVIVGVIALVVGLSFLLAYPTLWLANYLFAPSALLAVFGVSHLTFWKAWTLDVLCGLLFKSSASTSSK